MCIHNCSANILFCYVDYFNGKSINSLFITHSCSLFCSDAYRYIALVDDWIGPDHPDLVEFVAVDWSIAVELSSYEVFVFTNRYNWVDNAPDGRENSKYM